MEKEALFGKTLKELQVIVKELGFPGFTAKQIADWLYKKKIGNIEDMLNISKKNRDILSQKYKVGLSAFDNVQESVDGTKKYLFHNSTKQFIEAAYIPSVNRTTLCVSSQVGCKMGCLFCMTGKQGFQKNLTAGEILNQMVSIPEKDELTNLVYMGMGEPMDNIDEVLKSLEIITSEWGFAWSPRRINVSTIGVVPAMRRLMLFPWDITQIIYGREMRRRRDVSQREIIARQPCPFLGQKPDIIQMIVNIRMPRTHARPIYSSGWRCDGRRSRR